MNNKHPNSSIEISIIILITITISYFLSSSSLSFLVIAIFVYTAIYNVYKKYTERLKLGKNESTRDSSNNIDRTYMREFEILIQAYVDLEYKYAKDCSNITDYKKFRDNLDSLYDRFIEAYRHSIIEDQINKNQGEWLFYALRNANKSRHGMESTFSYLYDQMVEEDAIEKFKLDGPKNLSFYKENNIWYIDLPEFLEAGLGTKANLMMVAGADTLLDKLSKNSQKINLHISNCAFPGFTTWLEIEKHGKDDIYLQKIGHAPVDNGAYYKTILIENIKETNSVWLCPVTEYVFHGYYPQNIYIKIAE
jgi:hypothetical protein